MKTKDIIGVFAVTAAILMVPLIAMQFTKEVNWTLSDFVIMGILLAGTGLLVVLAARKVKSIRHRAVAIGVVMALFLLIWAELAVGVFGSPFAGS
jgi:hypothetical protein